MREVKFRGITNEFSSPRWVYGDLISDCTDEPRIMTDYHDCYEPVTWTVDPLTVGQFTGLLDADGREIYEGDIVTFGRGTEPSAVRWDNDFAYFVIMKSLLLGHACKAVRIIGNIHDNPELLGQRP